MAITMDGDEIEEITMDGDEITEVTMDGVTVWELVSYPFIIDDFESGNLNEYSGDLDEFEISSDTVYEGTYSLSAPAGSNYYIYSTSGLDNYPEQGDIMEVYFYISDSSWGTDTYTVGILFGFDDINNYYKVRIWDSYVRLERELGGSTTNLAQDDGFSGEGQTWYRLEITWETDNDISIVLYDDDEDTEEASLNVNDDNFSDGGIGFYRNWGKNGSISEFIFYDYYIITGGI